MNRDRTASVVLALAVGFSCVLVVGVVAGASDDVAQTSVGATASASTWGSYSGNDAVPAKAIDGDHGTKWGGTSGEGDWLRVTLDRPYRLTELRIDNGYHTLTYRVEVSADGSDWRTVAEAYESPGDNYIDDASDNVATFAVDGTTVRHVRITVLRTNAPSSHIWQAIIDEVEAVPVDDGNTTTAATATETPTVTPSPTPTATAIPTATSTPVVIPGFGWIPAVGALLVAVTWFRRIYE